VHKAIVGAGERRSTVLRDQFDHHDNPLLADGGVGGKKTCTNLSSGDSPYVPASCEPFFEQILDYMYTGQISLDADNVVYVCFMGRTLQCVALLHEIKHFLQTAIDMRTAPSLLKQSLEFSAEMGPVMSRCADAIMEKLDKYPDKTLSEVARLPIETVKLVLSSAPASEARRASHTAAVSHLVCKSLGVQDYVGASKTTDVAREAFYTLLPYLTEIHDQDVEYILQVILWVPYTGPIPKVGKVTYEIAAKLLPRAISGRHNSVLGLCTPVFAENLTGSKVGDLVNLKSHDTVAKILDSEGIRLSEDTVFEVIRDYIRTCEGLTEQQLHTLWVCCRFAFVSSKHLTTAAMDENIPSRPLRVAMAYRISNTGDRNAFPRDLRRLLKQRSGKFN